MDTQMPYIDLNQLYLEGNPSPVPFLNFLMENEELTCSIHTAAQFEGLEICNQIRKLSNDGLIQMAPRIRDIATLSLYLTMKGRELSCGLTSANNLTQAPAHDFTHFSQMPSSELLQLGEELIDK